MLRPAVPLLPPAAAFAAGIALAPWTPPVLAWTLWLAALAAGGGLALGGRTRAAAAPLLLAVAALGAVRGAPAPLPADHLARLPLGEVMRVEGRLGAEPTPWAAERTRLVLDVERADGVARSGRALLTLYGPAPPLAAGQRIVAEARLHRATGFRNPGTFDYAARLAREDVFVVGSARAERLEPQEAPAPRWHARVRRGAVAAMAEALPPVSAALLAGLLLGERTTLPPDLHDGFRRAGVYHVLAVSGSNVALVASAAWGLLALTGASRRVAAGGAMAAVLGFAAVVGPDPSVLRATIMAALILAALLLDREAAVWNSLGLAALLILAVRPGDLADPGFQLSFAATAGIVAAPLPRRALGAALGVSLAAQAAVLPITLAHFNQVSLIGVVANLGVVPLAAAATIAGLLAATLSFVSAALAAVVFDAVWPLLLLLRALVRLAAIVPGAVVYLPAPGPLAVAGYAGALAAARAAWALREHRPRAARGLGAAALGLLAGAAALAVWPLLRPPDGRLRVSVLDVGQGDAIVIEGPDGRAIVVDAGTGGPSRLDTGERVVAPFLLNRGTLRLAATLVTHPDIDHAGGMAAVHRVFGARERWDDRAPPAAPRWLGGAMVTALRPPATPHTRSRNDGSVVLRVDYGLASLLLASDIEAPAEEALLAAGAPLQATVLKVAHHGSRTSSSAAFLAAVRPSVAVISVGARNAYGHPDAGVLGRLAAAGARVYRTDRDGAVLLETDGRVLTVTRAAGGGADRYCLDPETIC